MKIIVRNSQKLLPITAKAVKKIVRSVVDNESQSCDEVAVHFITTKKMCEMHASYFNDGSPTDCISFPMEADNDEPYRMLGDVFVCPETALQYAAKHHVDPYLETTLYIVHGLLHLMGYDDMNSRDRKKMRAAEKRHMQTLLDNKEALCC